MDPQKLTTALVAATCILALAGPVAAEESEIEWLKRKVEELQRRVDELEAERRRDVEKQTPVVHQPQERDEATEKALDEIHERFGVPGVEEDGQPRERDEALERELIEWRQRFDLGHERRLEQLGKQEPAEVEVATEKPSELDVDIGGAVWINYAHQDWVGDDQGRKDNLRFDNLRLAVDSSYANFLMSAQYRFYSYTSALHHAWIGYRFGEDNQVELGVSQVPFGILPFGSHNFWFMIPYFVGLEDDYDAGIKWHYGFADDWTLDTAFYLNEEYDDATDLDRYSVDVVRDGDQQNDERNQFNLRLAYDWKLSSAFPGDMGIWTTEPQRSRATTGRPRYMPTRFSGRGT